MQDLTLEHLWPHNHIGFFVESGAHDGETGSNTLLYERRGWNGLLVEPETIAYKKLRRIRSAHSFHGVLSISTGQTHAIFPCNAGQSGSLIKWWQSNRTLAHGVCRVKSASLAELLDRHGHSTVDLWSLDVEGAEAAVLNHTDTNKIELGVVLVEANKGEQNTNGIRAALQQKGLVEIGRTHFLADGVCASQRGDPRWANTPLRTLDLIYANPSYFAKRGWTMPASVVDKQLQQPSEAKSRLGAVFESIYHDRRWDGGAGGGSGRGSELSAASGASRILFYAAMSLNVTSIVDAPCGAMRWQAPMLPQFAANLPGFRYLGLDVAESVITLNAKRWRHLSPSVRFEHADLTRYSPHGYELIFSRDALQHNSFDDIWRILWRWAESDATWILVGSYPHCHKKSLCGNRDIAAGGYFSVDLARPPFNLKPRQRFAESTDGEDKYLYLYERTALRLQLINRRRQLGAPSSPSTCPDQQSLWADEASLARVKAIARARRTDPHEAATALGSEGFLPIPKLLHQTWKGCTLPADRAAWHESCRALNPSWTTHLWTDDENREFVATVFPELLQLYDSYDMQIKRVDAVRLLYLYAFGGIYMDTDFACLKSMEALPLPDGQVVLGYQIRDESWPNAIANAWMAAPPGHPLIAFLIASLPLHAHKRVHEATGPEYLTARYKEYMRSPYNGWRHVTVYRMPLIYPFQWDESCEPLCGRGNTKAELQSCAQHFNESITVTFWTHSTTWVPEEKSWHKKRGGGPKEGGGDGGGGGRRLSGGRLASAGGGEHRCESWCHTHKASRREICTSAGWKKGRWCSNCQWCKCYEHTHAHRQHQRAGA